MCVLRSTAIVAVLLKWVFGRHFTALANKPKVKIAAVTAMPFKARGSGGEPQPKWVKHCITQVPDWNEAFARCFGVFNWLVFPPRENTPPARSKRQKIYPIAVEAVKYKQDQTRAHSRGLRSLKTCVMIQAPLPVKKRFTNLHFNSILHLRCSQLRHF